MHPVFYTGLYVQSPGGALSRVRLGNSVVHLGNQLIDMSTTLSGGSLGSCVDEERSQLCELMRSANGLEHRHLERTLRPWVFLWPRLSEGRLINYHDAQIVVAWVLPAGVITLYICVGCQIYGFSLRCRTHP